MCLPDEEGLAIVNRFRRALGDYLSALRDSSITDKLYKPVELEFLSAQTVFDQYAARPSMVLPCMFYSQCGTWVVVENHETPEGWRTEEPIPNEVLSRDYNWVKLVCPACSACYKVRKKRR